MREGERDLDLVRAGVMAAVLFALLGAVAMWLHQSSPQDLTGALHQAQACAWCNEHAGETYCLLPNGTAKPINDTITGCPGEETIVNPCCSGASCASCCQEYHLIVRGENKTWQECYDACTALDRNLGWLVETLPKALVIVLVVSTVFAIIELFWRFRGGEW